MFLENHNVFWFDIHVCDTVLVEVVQALCRDPNGDLANCIQPHAECMTRMRLKLTQTKVTNLNMSAIEVLNRNVSGKSQCFLV